MAGGHEAGFHPFDVTPPHLAYTILGGFVVFFGMFSLLIKEKLYIGEAPIATIFGIIIGPYGAGIFNPRGWGSDHETTNAITLEVTRVVLAVGVFAIGVELPKQYMLRHWKSLFYLLGPIMTYGWFVSAALIYALVPGLSFLSSLVIAACLTPTDPILAAAVVGGKYANKHVPAHIRQILAAESGCNDGAAFPFLFIAIYLTLEESDSHAVGEWFYITWLYEVLLGIVLGGVIGFGFRHLMKFCERKNLIDRHSYVAQYISLAMLAIGVTTLLGSDDLLAAFACGTAFAWDGWFNKQTEEALFSNVIDLLFNCACFIYIGAWIPFADFEAPEFTLSAWRLFVIAILVMLLRRLPIMIALYKFIPDIHTFHEALFSGHFGPIGVGAVFISTLASMKLPAPHNPPENQMDMLTNSIQPIIAFMVLISIAIHGLSIPFFSFGRRVQTLTYTWSRRYSMDPAAPEWANHVRRVPSRREDIVINRDHQYEHEAKHVSNTSSPEDKMEKGLIADNDETLASGSGSASSPATTPGSVPASRARTPPVAEGLSDPNARPDGAVEWREGPHLVVESECVPGEEVQVKVFRNAFSDDQGHAVESLGPKVREEVQKFKEDCRRTAYTAAQLMDQRRSLESARSRSPKVIPGPPAALADVPQEGSAPEVDQEPGPSAPPAAIVNDHTPQPPASSAERPHSPTKKHRGLGLKVPVFIHSRPTGRRRETVRQALFGKRAANAAKAAASEDGGPTPSSIKRTPSVAHSASSSAAASSVELNESADRGRPERPHMKAGHSRASSLRPTARDRGESPARVLRFAGESNATRTPHALSRAPSRTPSIVEQPPTASTSSPLSQQLSHTTSPASQGAAGPSNQEHGHVMFNLPEGSVSSHVHKQTPK